MTAIASARAVRRFAQRPLSAHDLELIVEAGRLAPSSNNEQRWAFILCTERDTLERLATVGEWTEHAAGAAAVIALVVPESDVDWERESIAFDAGQCVRTMMLAAWERGIGSCHGSVYQPDRTRELLGYPAGTRCDVLLSFGYLVDPTTQTRPIASTARRPVAELLHRERW
jgi:nitroreductase